MKRATNPSNRAIAPAQAFWKRRMMSPMSSGSSLAASCVDPTRSQNMTVTWRRSACCCSEGWLRRCAAARRSLRRCPRDRPMRSRSASSRSPRTSKSTSLSARTSAYWPRPSDESHEAKSIPPPAVRPKGILFLLQKPGERRGELAQVIREHPVHARLEQFPGGRDIVHGVHHHPVTALLQFRDRRHVELLVVGVEGDRLELLQAPPVLGRELLGEPAARKRGRGFLRGHQRLEGKRRKERRHVGAFPERLGLARDLRARLALEARRGLDLDVRRRALRAKELRRLLEGCEPLPAEGLRMPRAGSGLHE